MKKFLSIISSIFNEGVLIISKIAPFASLFPTLFPGSQLLTTVATDIKLAITEIVNVESIITTPGSGTQRLAAAAPRVAAIFTTAINELGLQIADEKAASVALVNITSSLADFINSCKKK